jgi:hypothetical protein
MASFSGLSRLRRNDPEAEGTTGFEMTATTLAVSHPDDLNHKQHQCENP